jgi:hypothetical protein
MAAPRPEPPSADSWFVPPGHPLNRWYSETYDALQLARATHASTGACAVCQAKGTVSDGPRSYHCARCGATYDVSDIASFEPQDKLRQLRDHHARLTGLLYTAKADTAYRGLDLYQAFEALATQRDQVAKRIAELEALPDKVVRLLQLVGPEVDH